MDMMVSVVVDVVVDETRALVNSSKEIAADAQTPILYSRTIPYFTIILPTILPFETELTLFTLHQINFTNYFGIAHPSRTLHISLKNAYSFEGGGHHGYCKYVASTSRRGTKGYCNCFLVVTTVITMYRIITK